MPNLATALKDEITRLARKEIKKEVAAAKKQQAQHRRDIASLKREVAQLQRQVAYLEKQEKRRLKEPPAVAAAVSSVAPARDGEGRSAPRFQARGLRSHREKLGLSAADYGQLLGVSGLTVYNWEKEKSKPRKSQVAKIVEIRGIGRREALRRLELL